MQRSISRSSVSPTELCLVVVFRVVHWPPSPFCGGHLLGDLRAAGPPAAAGERGDGRHGGLAAAPGEGVHGRGHAEPSAAAGESRGLSSPCLCVSRVFVTRFVIPEF